MERKFVDSWNAHFEVKPPEWAFRFSDSQDYLLEDIEREISKREANIEQIETELQQEKFLLSWLSQRKAAFHEKPSETGVLMNGECSGLEDSERHTTELGNTPNSSTDNQDSTEAGSSHNLELSGSTEYHTVDNYSSRDTLDTNLSTKSDSPVVLRHRFTHTVQKTDVQLARGVSQRLFEQGKYNSCTSFEFQLSSEQPEKTVSIRRSLSDPVKKLSGIGDVLKSPKKQGLETAKRLESEEFEVQREPLTDFLQGKPSQTGDMISDDTFETECVPVVGEKRSSNGIILDSMDTNKILALDDEGSENELLSSMGSRAQRTRTPRNSIESSRIKMVRLSNGDLDSSPKQRYSFEGKENSSYSGETDPAVARRQSRNSSEYAIKRSSTLTLEDDECTTPRGDMNMPLTSENVGVAVRGVATTEQPCEDIIDEDLDPTMTITRQTAYLAKNRPFDRTETLTHVAAEQVAATLDDIDPTPKEEGLLELASDIHGSNTIPLSRLDSLSEELQKALSQISSTPEMSMATLLDIGENTEMNKQLEQSQSNSEHSSMEDLEIFESGKIDEATISAWTLRSDMYSSSTSIPSLFVGNDSMSSTCSSPPDNPASPNHSMVNLRNTGGNRNRGMRRRGNADLDSMATAGSDESSENSPAHFHQGSTSPLPDEMESVIPGDKYSDDDLSSPMDRTSRIFPVKRSTVVVHGEQLVIRKLVVAGIVSAEKSYLECLTTMREYYRKPLLGRATTTLPILQERDINTIFYRIEDLCSLHTTLHDQLEPSLARWSIKTCVGEFFVHLCRNLKLYKDYVEMYKKSVDCLRKHKQENPLFQSFIEDVHDAVSKNYKDIPRVNELLRRPVERLQSYSLVLNDLCQHTPEEHPDYRILRESLQVMTAFIASTHDPHSFKHLSGGFNRELVKDGLVVELSDGIRKIRRVFLFHDVLVCSKQKPSRGGVKFEPKWYLPLNEISFKPPEDSADAHRPVPVTSDVELSVMKNKIAELKAQLSKETGARDRTNSATSDKEDKSSFVSYISKRNLKAGIQVFKGKNVERYRKKLEEQEVSYWVASPSLPLRLYGRAGKQFMFVLHTEEERESWVSAIKKLQPKVVTGVYLSSYELNDLLSKQSTKDLRRMEDMVIPTIDEEYLYGVLRVRVTGACDLKAKPAGVYCCLELDEYGKFERKARTLPTTTDNPTLVTTWDQDFEIELTGAHILKVQICSKSLLKEETHANGKVRLPIKQLKQNKRQKMEIKLMPQGSIDVILEYFNNFSAMGRKPSLLSSGVFGVPIEVVSKRERHDIPLIVQTCIDEIERRGMTEVGLYRVAGVLRDVQELRNAFDTDYLRAQMIAFEADIHAVAGLLKRYFRELPDPLFTNELYTSFVQGLALSDPEARAQCLLALLHSLPAVNFKTAVFLFKHLRRVAANSVENKMSLNNLSTVFGPNLLSPGGDELKMDVVTPVSVVLFFLNCPEEYFDESLYGHSELSTSTSSSNKSNNTNGRGQSESGRGSFTPVESGRGSFPPPPPLEMNRESFAERRDSTGSSTPLATKKSSIEELDSPLANPSPSRGGNNRRSKRTSNNKLFSAIKFDSKSNLPSGKESVI